MEIEKLELVKTVKLFDKFKKKKEADPIEFWNKLSTKYDLNREAMQEMSDEALGELISKAQAAYRQGISADRAGEISIARELYRRAFELLPTHAEALDNYAIGLVEEFKFGEAIPLFEQSAAAEPNSALSFVYLVKCYEETGASDKSLECANYLSHLWPDKSPYVDWSHLDKPKEQLLISPPLAEGQVWEYKTREQDTGSKVWIKLIEQGPQGNPIAHISVTDIVRADGTRIFMSHLPYDANALLECLTAQTTEKQTWQREDDHFGEGYGMWLEAFQAGEAGVFTAPVDVIIKGMIDTIPE